MSLNDPGNLKVGGVVLDVALDLRQLRRDLDSVGSMLERFARDTKLDLTASARGGSAASSPAKASGSGGSAASRALSVGLASSATAGIGQAMARVQQSMDRVGKDMARSLDGVIDQVMKVARHAKTSARFSSSSEKAAQDLYRAEKVDYHTAQQERLADRALGYKQTIRSKPGNVANLPADVRYLSGIGFDPATLVARGGRGTAASATSPGVSAAGQAGAQLQQAAVQLKGAAAALGRAASPASAFPNRPAHPHAGIPIPVGGGFLDDAKTMPVGSKIDPLTGQRVGPAYWRSKPRKPPDPGFSRAVLPMQGPGLLPPTSARMPKGRSGKITLPDVGAELDKAIAFASKGVQGSIAKVQAMVSASKASLADAFARMKEPGAIKAAGKAVSVRFLAEDSKQAEGLVRVQAALRATGHVGMEAFGRVMDGARSVERQIGRVALATRGLRSIAGTGLHVLATPFTLGARAIGLFDTRVGAGTNALRLIGKVGQGLTGPLMAPFIAAKAAAGAFSSMLKGLATAALMMGASILTEMAVKGVLASVHLGDSVNAVKSVFKGATSSVTGFADAMAAKLGMARKDTLDASVVIGGALKGAGLGTEHAAVKSNVLTARAADIAAQRQVPVADVSHAMATALAGGSTRALRTVGVSIDADQVKAKALAMGLVAVGHEASRSDKAMATYELILEKSADASGFLTKNSTSTAGAMDILTGRFHNATAAIGAKLEPAFTEILLLFDEFITGTAKATKAVHDWVGGIVEGVVEAVRFLRKMWAEWDTGVQLVGLLAQQMGENFTDSLKWIGSAAKTLLDWLGTNWRAVLTDIGTVAVRIFSNIGKLITEAWVEVQKAANLDFGNVDWSKFDPVANLQKIIDLKGAKLVAPPIVFEKFTLTNSFKDRITDAITKIMGVEVRLPTKDTLRKGLDEDSEDPDKDKKAKKGKASNTGNLVDARGLLDSLQKSIFDKDSDHIAATARNTGDLVKGVVDVADAVRGVAQQIAPKSNPPKPELARMRGNRIDPRQHALNVKAKLVAANVHNKVPKRIRVDPGIARLHARAKLVADKVRARNIAAAARKKADPREAAARLARNLARGETMKRFDPAAKRQALDLIGVKAMNAEQRAARDQDTKHLARANVIAEQAKGLLQKIADGMGKGMVARLG